jgi:hypothetical protein
MLQLPTRMTTLEDLVDLPLARLPRYRIINATWPLVIRPYVLLMTLVTRSIAEVSVCLPAQTRGILRSLCFQAYVRPVNAGGEDRLEADQYIDGAP